MERAIKEYIKEVAPKKKIFFSKALGVRISRFLGSKPTTY